MKLSNIQPDHFIGTARGKVLQRVVVRIFVLFAWGVIGGGLLLAPFSTVAGDLEWSGLYRAEGYSIMGPALDSNVNKRKEYGVHTLILRPKIVAADGLYINAQLNIFNAQNGDATNQLGAYFGHGIGAVTPASSNDSNSLSENETSEDLKVSQFYLTHVQEYGSLIVGRAPLQFGLGISHNAGRDLFDHYSDTRDLVGYKIMMGNFYFLPMYAKINEGNISGYGDVNEFNIQLQYENPESDAAMGMFYQNRTSSNAGNDAPDDVFDYTGTGGTTGQYNAKNFNIFYKKETATYTSGVEVAQQGGESGVVNGSGQEVTFSGFGVAAEYEWHPKEKRTAFGLKAGYATGDDPSTTNDYEGFIFDRNYDVAMFLFNHGLGQADLLKTKLIGRTETGGNDNTVNGQPDVEAISNVTYFSPYMKYKWSDKWSMVGVLTTGWLDSDKVLIGGVPVSADANLGYELDLSLVFNVSEKITWVNQMGYFEPGAAWEVNGNFGTKSVYGFVTKAAVSF